MDTYTITTQPAARAGRAGSLIRRLLVLLYGEGKF